MTRLGRMRASNNLRKTMSIYSASSAGVNAGTPVEIIGDEGLWFKVRLAGATAKEGYTTRLSVALEEPAAPVFPSFSGAFGRQVAGVPPELRVSVFVDWLAAGGQPAWLAADDWNGQSPEEQDRLRADILLALDVRQAAWQSWLALLQASKRLEQATLDEWLVLLAGGRNLWSVRSERIRKTPTSSAAAAGWANVDDILLWTGQVAYTAASLHKLWYQVRLYKMGRQIDGWYRHDLLDAYIFPTSSNDPDNPQNARYVYDLTRPLLRLPADPEIAAALATGYQAGQYINIKAVIGTSLIHRNLCGQFCVAALLGEDVIPLLKCWLPSSLRAASVLKRNLPTGLYDLANMLRLYGLEGENFQSATDVAYSSPVRFKQMLERGRMPITGVSITPQGRLSAKGSIPHWVVVEDVLPVGAGGWVRVYNPFNNREEVYPWSVYIQAIKGLPVGMWVTPQAAT